MTINFEEQEEEDSFDYEYSSSPKGLVDTLVMYVRKHSCSYLTS